MRKERKECECQRVCALIITDHSTLIRNQRAHRRGFYRRDYRLLLLRYRVSSSLSFRLYPSRLALVLHAGTDDINDPRRITSVCPRTLDRAILRKATRRIHGISGRSSEIALSSFLSPASVFLQVPRYSLIKSCFTCCYIFELCENKCMFRESALC